ncbi:MAG: YceH family protein [Burkholderiaceae bacterium]|nr:YceH family protein [Burkholderiaceae bacterium]
MPALSRPLTAIEARVLGTLMEKARTVPDTYPLSLNLVLTGCNQKTSREPVLSVTETEAEQALSGLAALGLVQQLPGSRVARYQHNAQHALGVPEQSAVLLGVLMLRGAQTAAELRLNAERWYRFADVSSVEAFLHELAARSGDKGGPLALHLPRAPGEREARWAHLLCGPVQTMTQSAPVSIASSADSACASGQNESMNERLERLEREVAELRLALEDLRMSCPLSPPGRTMLSGHATTPHSAEEID